MRQAMGLGLRPALIIFLLGAASSAGAQSSPASSDSARPSTQQVVVTGNPLQRTEASQPAELLSGDGLVIKMGATLGQTLDSLPGVASTSFGPNASRPAIRGLDGDRVRLLENSGASIDASNLSFDHAVALDPLVIERIEVLRGPAALLYGGNATGGVVNTLDNRIPKWPVLGTTGRVDVRLGGAALERAASALLEGGQGPWAWHIDAFDRTTVDLRVPWFVPVTLGPGTAPTRQVRNSASRSLGGAVGASWVSTQGYAGVALDTYRNDYGVTVEPDVTIRMKRERLSAAAQWRQLPGLWSQVDVQASRTRYRHLEVEGTGEVGTTFNSEGSDFRLQAQHAPWGAWRGVMGLQAEDLQFSALGEEAFVPSTRTRSSALFVVESWRVDSWPDLEFSAGMRAEQVQVASQGDDRASLTSRFGPGMRRDFAPRSASASAQWQGAQSWRINASWGHTERAPAYYELFAQGPHVATGAYEQGDATLGVERSRHAEVGFTWTEPTARQEQGQDASRLKFQVFDTRFGSFIALDATQELVDDLPEYQFKAVRARLRGWELESRWRLWQRPVTWDLIVNLDAVKGDNLDTGEPLARLAPRRATVGAEWEVGSWRGGLQWRHQARQDRVPSSDVPTPGASRVDAWMSRTLTWAGSRALWVLRAQNLTNALWFNAATVQTVRSLSPAAGRALSTSVRVDF